MPDNKENKHCAEFSSILYLHGQIIDTKEKEHCTTIYRHNCEWHSVGVQACHECGEHEQSDHDPEWIALCHHAILLHLLHPPPPSLTLLCPHPSLSSHCPHLQAETRLDGPFICLNSLFCLDQSMTIVSYLKILKLTIVGWCFYSTLSFSACSERLKMFTYWRYFHTSRQQRIVEIAGSLHQLSGSCDRPNWHRRWCQSVAVVCPHYRDYCGVLSVMSPPRPQCPLSTPHPTSVSWLVAARGWTMVFLCK